MVCLLSVQVANPADNDQLCSVGDGSFGAMLWICTACLAGAHTCVRAMSIRTHSAGSAAHQSAANISILLW